MSLATSASLVVICIPQLNPLHLGLCLCRNAQSIAGDAHVIGHHSAVPQLLLPEPAASSSLVLPS